MSLKTWGIGLFLKGKLPMWVYRLIGKQIAKKIKLVEEDNMADTDTTVSPPWYRKKTSWIAILGAILGAVQPVSAALGHPIVIPAWVFEVLAGLGLYTLRSAVSSETSK